MARRLILLLALGGCDMVFGLNRPDMPHVCGPYGVPEEVMFSPALVGAHDFSIDPSGLHGMVHANLGVGGLPAWDGPHAIIPDGNGVWIQDGARDKAVLNSFQGGHLTASGQVVAWIDMPRGVMANLLMFGAGAWSQVTDVLDTQVADRDLHIGNVIDLDVGSGLVQRFAVEIRPPADFNSIGQIGIIQRVPGNAFWAQTTEVRDLNQADPKIDLNGGVLTADHEKLVYSGKRGSSPVSRIFASERTLDQFSPSAEIVIQGVHDDEELTEPWINADCTELYFRQGDTTWLTTAVTP